MACGVILGWLSGAYHFESLLPWHWLLTSFLCVFLCLEHISYITNNFPQNVSYARPIPLETFVTLLCHVCLLTMKYISTVQYLSLSFPYIHNLWLSHFSQLKGCSWATLSCDSSYSVSSHAAYFKLKWMGHRQSWQNAVKYDYLPVPVAYTIPIFTGIYLQILDFPTQNFYKTLHPTFRLGLNEMYVWFLLAYIP